MRAFEGVRSGVSEGVTDEQSEGGAVRDAAREDADWKKARARRGRVFVRGGSRAAARKKGGNYCGCELRIAARQASALDECGGDASQISRAGHSLPALRQLHAGLRDAADGARRQSGAGPVCVAGWRAHVQLGGSQLHWRAVVWGARIWLIWWTSVGGHPFGGQSVGGPASAIGGRNYAM